MNDCCQTKKATTSKEKICPSCHSTLLGVSSLTLLHQLKYPFNSQLKQDTYLHCANADCDLVYTDVDLNQTWDFTSLRKHTLKAGNPKRILCHCFGINEEKFTNEVQNNESKIFDFIVAQTKNKNCTCQTSNPSGSCCLPILKHLQNQ